MTPNEEYLTDLAGQLQALGVEQRRIEEVLGEGAIHDAKWQHWAFRADAFAEMNFLEHLGREGWEVTEVRSDAHFSCRRHVLEPQPWVYQRRTGVRRESMRDEMERGGWRHCGTWVVFQYFKRPLAVAQ